MAKSLFVIITRMHAIKGAAGEMGDEYVAIWLRDAEEEFAYFMRPTCDVLIVHGHRNKYTPGNYKKDAANQIRQAIEDSALRLDQYDRLYVLYHATDTVTLSPEDMALAFGGRSVNLTKYSSMPTASKAGPWVKGALEQLGFPEDLIREVIGSRLVTPGIDGEQTPSSTAGARREAFSHLKHQIGHLFLPLSIDLQGMELVEGAERLAYAEEILKDRRGKQPLKQRFANLRFLVAKVDDGNGKTLSVESLVGGFSVWDWISAAGQEGTEAGRNLLALAGITLAQGRPAVDQKSGVLSYFSTLDAVAVAENLMPAMTASFRISLWENGQTTEARLGFDKWLNELDNSLDELRGILIRLGEESGEVIHKAG